MNEDNLNKQIISLRTLFPLANKLLIYDRFKHCITSNPHETIANILTELVMGSFDWVYAECVNDAVFENTSKQATYAFALLLHCMGIKEIFVHETHGESAAQEKEMYIIEVCIEHKSYYISPKHFTMSRQLKTLLKPESHDAFTSTTGSIKHPDDPNKSGIYLRTENTQHPLQIRWRKQDYKQPVPVQYHSHSIIKIEW